MKVFIGYDVREPLAAEVCARSLRKATRDQIEPEFLCAPKLHDQGLLTRPVDHRGGRDYDLVSNEFTSTRFNISRFLTPILCQQGYALFVDSDTIFLRDPREMLSEIHARHAVSVVKHAYVPLVQSKMVNQVQSQYERKCWSSVMMFNCDHVANRRLSLRDVNERDRSYLHGFGWLADTEVGDLYPRWNWLVDVAPRPVNLGIAHLTLGGPWLDGWLGGSYDSEWLKAGKN